MFPFASGYHVDVLPELFQNWPCFLNDVIKGICTHTIIVVTRLCGCESDEYRVIGGDEGWDEGRAQSVTAGGRVQRLGRHRQETDRGCDEWKEGGGGGCRRRPSEPGWVQAKSSARGNSSGWQRPVYQSTTEHTVSPTHVLLCNCGSRPLPLAWTVAPAPEPGPLTTEESPRCARCQGRLIWAR